MTLQRVASVVIPVVCLGFVGSVAGVSCTNGTTASQGTDAASGDGTAPDGSTAADDKCAELRMLEVRTSAPSSSLALYFSANNCAGDPLPGLDRSRFLLTEDDKALVPGTSVTAVDIKGEDPFVDILLDMSSQTAGYRGEILRAAQTLVDTLAAAGRRIHVGVRVFAGKLGPVLAPTLDLEKVKATLAGLGTYVSPDESSTDVFGSIANSIRQLRVESKDFVDRNGGSGFAPRYVVTFTSGVDTAQREPAAAVAKSLSSIPSLAYSIVVSSPAFTSERAAEMAVATPDGVSQVAAAADLDGAARGVGARIVRQFGRTYVLGYCSAARAGTHKLTISLDSPSVTRSPATGFFEADKFGVGCSPAVFLRCDGQTCARIACGSCDDRNALCDATVGRCVDFCETEQRCGDEAITNRLGYSQICASVPTRTACSGEPACVDTTSSLTHCGGCDKDCYTSAAKCVGASPACVCDQPPCPQRLLGPLEGVDFILDGGVIYYGEYRAGQNSVNRMPAGGGPSTRLATLDFQSAHLFGVANGKLFWLRGGFIESVPTTGGAVAQVAQVASGHSFTLAGGFVYWVDGVVRRVAASGGTPEVLEQPWNTGTSGPMAADGSHLYLQGRTGEILRVPIADLSTADVFASNCAMDTMAIVDGNVFGQYRRAASAGIAAARPAVASDCFEMPYGDAFALPGGAAGRVYFTGTDPNTGKRALLSVGMDSLASRVEMFGVGGTYRVAADASNVYWSHVGRGAYTILKRPR